jgi:TnpA family transposase
VLLSVVLEQETEPTEIMTDTGAYTDAIFGIFYLLGFQSARGSPTPAASDRIVAGQASRHRAAARPIPLAG